MKKLLLGVGMVMMAATSFAQATDHLELVPEKNLLTAEVGETVDVTIKFAHVSDTLYSGLQFDLWLPDWLEVQYQDEYYSEFGTTENSDFDNARKFNYTCNFTSDNSHYGNDGKFWRIVGKTDSPDKNCFPSDDEMDELFFFTVEVKEGKRDDICPMYIRLTQFTSQVKEKQGKTLIMDTDENGKVVISTNFFPDTKYLAYKVPACGYSTLCINDDLDFTDLAVSANVCSDLEDGFVKGTEVKKVKAGTPLIIKGDAGAYELKANYGENDAEQSNLLVGTADGPVIVSGNTTFALANKGKVVGFYRCEEGVEIPQYKAYINSSDNVVEGFIFAETTGINQVNSTAVQDGSIYTITGAKVNEATQKGVYIKDGKKVVVK